ncbi:MAG TPA: amino acid adenylation domain-containing protein, partial [Bacillota bacterium]|nr:amino acid adenylation domain-containing protein [Bacillota bacterium]
VYAIRPPVVQPPVAGPKDLHQTPGAVRREIPMVQDSLICATELREYLKQSLPEYMIPSYFGWLDHIPLTASGKVDRKTLAETGKLAEVGKLAETGKLAEVGKYAEAGKGLEVSGVGVTGAGYVAPRTETETKLAAIWQELLGIDKVGVNDKFFDLGGHSLKATILVLRILKEFGVDLPLKAVFTTPTIEGLSQQITLMKKDAGAEAKPDDLVRLPKEEYYPVSAAQRRMFILSRMEPEGVNYNIPLTVIIEGDLNHEDFEAAFQKLAQRHEALRTSFELMGGEPVQRVHEEVELQIHYYRAYETGLARMVTGLIRPFDLSQPPLFRVELITFEAEKHLLLFDIHHIIADGVSIEILVREFGEFYAGKELPELTIQYRDFSRWQNRFFQTESAKRQEEYWLAQFAGEIPVLNLPTDNPRPVVQSFAGAQVEFTAGQELTKRLLSTCRGTGATLFMVLLAAFDVLLARYPGQEDLVVGTPIAGRLHADLESVVGMFVNTLALRNQPKGELSFQEFLAGLKENTLAAYENQQYQFDELVEHLKIKRDLGRNPLFDVMFTLQNFAGNWTHFTNGGLRFSPYDPGVQAAKFDLTLTAVELSETISFTLEYATGLFKEDSVHRMGRCFLRILEQITRDPLIRLAEIELLDEAEKNWILSEFNNTKAPYPQGKTIIHLFEEQVERTPKRSALKFGDQNLTYGELNQRSNQLSRRLRGKGAGADKIIGIMMERSIEMIIGVLGILKAGAAYLPIDPHYPQSRIDFLLGDGCPEILLTPYPWNRPDLPLTVIDPVDKGLCELEATNPEVPIEDHDLAYIIYTSGSTGAPKGVMIEHRSLLNTILWRKNEYHFEPDDVSLQLFSYCFDGFLTSLFTPLVSGAEIVLLGEEDSKNPLKIKERILEDQITHFICIPTLYAACLEISGFGEINSLKAVTLAGEKVTSNLIQNSRLKAPKIKLQNEYGPTENTVVTTCLTEITDEEMISIGKPIANNQVYLINPWDRLQPVGVPGELCISGDGLARGYLNQPELTAEKFVVGEIHEFPLQRIYRTGDLARWLPDGNIEFLGRRDEQVKIRGFRIELGEIENRIRRHQEIGEAVVVTVAGAGEEPDGGKYLCAYYIAKREITGGELRSFLALELPEYMIPSFLIQLERFPLTMNGKLDRKALPEPLKVMKNHTGAVAPRTETELRLAALWREILGVEQVGVTDNFFELGGHSLKVVALMAGISREFGVELPLKEVYTAATIQQLAELINRTWPGGYGPVNSQMVPISAGNDPAKHFFFVHGGDGDIEAYLTLCNYLDPKFHYWGIQAERFPDPGPQNITIETLAVQYLRKIKQIQPQGPYYLGGWSFGGTVAVEIARRIEINGEEIQYLALLDATAPAGNIEEEGSGFSAEAEKRMIEAYFPIDPINRAIQDIDDSAEIWRLALDVLEQTYTPEEFRILLRRNIAPLMYQTIPNIDRLGIREIVNYFNMLRSFDHARSLYGPLQKVQTQIHFFAAQPINGPNPTGWEPVCEQPLNIHSLPGDHFSMMKEPVVKSVAAILSKTLAEAEGE